MDMLFAVIFGIFMVLLVLNFVFQFYVAILVSNNLFFALRGTKVFIQGWQHAEKLGIKPVMTVWSWVVVLMLVMICPLAVAGYARNAQNTPSIERRPAPTIQALQWEITSPKPGDVLRQSDGEAQIIGFVNFNIQQVEYYQLWIRGHNQTMNLGYKQNMPIREPGSVLEIITLSLYTPGQWEIGLEVVMRGAPESRRPSDDLEWIPFTIVP